MAYCSCRYRCVCVESLVARMLVLYVIERSWWTKSKVYSVKNLLKSATKLIIVLGKVCLHRVSPFAILSFSCPCSDLQRSGSSPFSKKMFRLAVQVAIGIQPKLTKFFPCCSWYKTTYVRHNRDIHSEKDESFLRFASWIVLNTDCIQSKTGVYHLLPSSVYSEVF